MIELRRRIFKLKAQDGYVQDGLIFHLDGKEKTETTWTDLIGGVQFDISSCDKSDDYVNIKQPIIGSADVTIKPLTIELVINNHIKISNGTRLIDSNGIGMYLDYDYCYYKRIKGDAKSLIYNVGIHIYSTISSFYMNNMTMYANKGGSVSVPSADKGLRIGVGIRNTDIYSIRCYNRELSAEEILQNQNYDNERFELGL